MLSRLPKKIACAFLVAAMLMSSAVSAGASNAMADGHWAEKEVDALTDAGYITETTDPDAGLTVKEFCAILSEITGEEIDAATADETALSREIAFELLGKLAELSSENSDALSTFTDADAIIASARDEIAAMVASGYIKGKGNGTLDPDAGMTIAEFATMYSRLKYILAADADGYVYGTARLTWEQFWANEGITYDASNAFDAVNETLDTEGMADLGGFDAVTRATSKHGIYRGAAHYSYLIHGADEAGNTVSVYLEDMTDADTVADMYGAGKNFYGVNGAYQITQPESGEYTTYTISNFEVVGYKAWPVKMLASDAEKLADSMHFVLDSSVTAETGRLKTISAAEPGISAGKAAEASGKTYEFDGKTNLTYDDSYGDYIFVELGSISDTEWGMNLLGATYEYYGETDPSAEGASPIASYGTKYGADTWWKSNGKTLHLGINTSYRHGGAEQYGYWKINIMSAGYEDVSVVVKALPAYAAEVAASIAADNKTVTISGITDADWANTTVSVDGTAVEMKNGSAVIEGMAVGAHTVTIGIDGYREITDEIIVDSGLTAEDIALTGNALFINGGDISNYLANITGIAVDGTTLSGSDLGNTVFNEDGTVNFAAEIASKRSSTVVFPYGSGKSYMLIVSAAGYPSVVLNTSAIAQYVYGTASLTYGEFYSGDVSTTEYYGIDGVTSATVEKYKSFNGNMYTNYTEEKTDGYNILGVQNVNVAVYSSDLEEYLQLNPTFTPVRTAPEQYKTVSIVDGRAVYSATEFNLMETVTDASAELVTGSTWGDYQINVIENSTAYIRNNRSDEGWVVNANVQGIILETETGRKVGMEHLQSIWVQPWEISFNVDEDSTCNSHIVGWDNLPELTALVGEKVVSITYIMPDSTYVYTFDGIYIKPAYSGSEIISASFTEGSAEVSVTNVPAIFEDVTVDIYYGSGRKKTYVASDAVIVDGKVTMSEAYSSANTYTVTVSSSNYASVAASSPATSAELELLNILILQAKVLIESGTAANDSGLIEHYEEVLGIVGNSAATSAEVIALVSELNSHLSVYNG